MLYLCKEYFPICDQVCVCVCVWCVCGVCVCVCVCACCMYVQLNVHNHHSEDVEFVTYTNDGLVCCTRSLPFQYDGDS